LAVYNNEFILVAHASAQKIIETIKSLKKTTVYTSPQPLKWETSMRLVCKKLGQILASPWWFP